VRMYGGDPFVGKIEMSVHWSTQPNWDIGPLSTVALTPRGGGKVTLLQFGVESGGIIVYVA